MLAALNGDKIEVTWDALEHAQSYIVYRTSPTATKKVVATVSNTSYADENLSSSGKYTYYVVAVPATDDKNYVKSGYSNPSNVINYNKPKPTEPPTEPSTEPSTEKPTEAPTEPPTEKPTEPSTEKPTENPTKQNVEEPTKTDGRDEHKINKIFVYKKLKYQIKDTAKRTVRVFGAKSKKIKKVSIPKKVIYKNVTYKVVEVRANAFKGCKKLNSVTIGSGITGIGKKAFFKCKKLKKILIKSKNLKKVGKKAFGAINKNAVIKVLAKRKKKYTKLLKKKITKGNKIVKK